MTMYWLTTCLFWILFAQANSPYFHSSLTHLHYNVFERKCEAISGRNGKIARNCLTSTIKHIVMQMRNVNCEKSYCKVKKLGRAL